MAGIGQGFGNLVFLLWVPGIHFDIQTSVRRCSGVPLLLRSALISPRGRMPRLRGFDLLCESQSETLFGVCPSFRTSKMYSLRLSIGRQLPPARHRISYYTQCTMKHNCKIQDLRMRLLLISDPLFRLLTLKELPYSCTAPA